MTSPYIHGTDPEEQGRLSRLNDLLNPVSLRMLSLQGGERILDVGSGLGQLTRGMARQAGGTVIGIEKSAPQRERAAQLAEADGESELIEIREGSAQELPLQDDEWGTFDLVHTRFLLEHVPDPGAVVRTMVRAARPGGRIVLEDDDHDVLRVWPEPAGLGLMWNGLIELFRARGYTPDIGRRLVSLLHEAGADPVRNDWLFFGGCAGDDRFATLVRNFADIWEGAREGMIERGLIDREALDEGLRAWHEWGERPDASLWYAWAWAEGRRRV